MTPVTQAAVDYLLVGGFLLGGTLLWKHNRRWAVAALVAGGSGLGTIVGLRFPRGGWLASMQAALAAGVHALASFGRRGSSSEFEALGIGA